MADPVIVDITPVSTWVKVATNITNGQIWIVDGNAEYLQTYRMTGNPAPVDNTDAQPINTPSIGISASAGVDVYVKAIRVVGKVRVDV